MRNLTFAMNLSLDGHIAVLATTSAGAFRATSYSNGGPRGSGPTGLALYGRKLWETMSSHWPTVDQKRTMCS